MNIFGLAWRKFGVRNAPDGRRIVAFALAGARGQTTVAAALLLVVLILVAAGLTDAYILLETRAWARQVAEDAAISGASAGRDWDGFIATGEMRLIETTAYDVALDALGEGLSQRSAVTAVTDVRVLPDPSGGVIPSYPPLARADIFGSGDWTTTEPAVGVYLTLPVETVFYRLAIGSGQPVELHVFAAAGVATQTN